MIDLHSHVLPGVDDGARTIEDSRELASKAASEGITAIAATPHVRHDYPTTPDRMDAEVTRSEETSPSRGFRSRSCTAARSTSRRCARSARMICGDSRSPERPLPPRGVPVPRLAARPRTDAVRSGTQRVRSDPRASRAQREVQAEPGRLSSFVDRGGLVQITAASLDGRIGRRSRQAAQELIEAGLAHLLASDAHLPEIREVGLAAAAEALDDELARYLTQTAPSAIVAGEAVPPPPARRRRRRFLRR